jgi:hypothetical protein
VVIKGEVVKVEVDALVEAAVQASVEAIVEASVDKAVEKIILIFGRINVAEKIQNQNEKVKFLYSQVFILVDNFW